MNDISFLYSILMTDQVEETVKENQIELFKIIPELKYEVGFDHKHPHHHLDVWNHTLLALSLSIKDFDIRLVLLLHDIGKPFSYQEEDGIRHFHNHAEKSEKISKKILKRLGFKKEKIKELTTLIKYHDTEITDEDLNKNPELTLKRYEIQKCDALAHHPKKLEKRKKYLDEIKEKIKVI
ncbi:MAG: HD domain-containing protein [Firmicutes bacterium]|nr:HD domain-containing protein [Bacillota bacterium]